MDSQQGYILVVDDVPDILELLDTTLKFKGYHAVTARNGQEALEIIQRKHPALLIADILMPTMDGFSLVHRLRLDPTTRDIPVIFLSATYVTPEDKDFALTIGVTRFIEKPVDLESFLPMISDFLAQGDASATEPLNELEFYRGYHKRLEAKLKQKDLQIVRDEHLLESIPETERPAFEASLHQTIHERDELQNLLEQIRQRLEEKPKTE